MQKAKARMPTDILLQIQVYTLKTFNQAKEDQQN